MLKQRSTLARSLAHLVIVSVVVDNVDRLNDVDMLERDTHTELGRHLLLVLLLAFAQALGPELLDGIDDAARLGRPLDEADGASCSGTEDTSPLAVLLREMGLRCVGE